MVESKKLQMAFLALFVVLFILLAKLVNAGIQHCVILDAILDYKIECIMDDEPYFVDNDDRETLGDTFWRLWDWSDRHILDNDEYRIIKPYIQQGSWADAAGEYFGG